VLELELVELARLAEQLAPLDGALDRLDALVTRRRVDA
jgi:hypothetical protein